MTTFPADPEITAGTITLRRWRFSDVEALSALWQDAELRRRFGARSTTLTTVETFVRDAGRSWSAGAACWFAIVDADGAIVGGCDLGDLDDRVGPADVGYWIAASHRGQGVAGLAVAALLDWARAELGVQAFALEVEPDDAASTGVATALGFAPDGTERRDRSTTPARTLVRYLRD